MIVSCASTLSGGGLHHKYDAMGCAAPVYCINLGYLVCHPMATTGSTAS